MDKGIQISPNTFMLTSGGVGDCTSFGEYIQKNLKLNELRNGVVASPWSTANFVRTSLAKALRSKDSKQVNLIVAGHAPESEDHAGPQVYFIDYMASMARVPFAAQGYVNGSLFMVDGRQKSFCARFDGGARVLVVIAARKHFHCPSRVGGFAYRNWLLTFAYYLE
jgi:hypothetical protein